MSNPFYVTPKTAMIVMTANNSPSMRRLGRIGTRAAAPWHWGPCTDVAKGFCDCQCRSRTLYYYWPTSLKRGSAIVVRLQSFNSNCRSMPRYAPLSRPTGDQENRDKSGYGPRRAAAHSEPHRERESALASGCLSYMRTALYMNAEVVSMSLSLSLSLGNERKNKEKSGGGRVTRAGRRRRRTRTGDPTSDD